MDIREYIESGILESYALGATTVQERKEVECLSKIYPELFDELTSIEKSIEKYTKSIAIKPPIELKSKILHLIKDVEQEDVLKLSVAETAPNIKSINDPKYNQTKKIRMIAASAAIVILSGVSVWQYSKVTGLKNQLALNGKEQLKQSETIAALTGELNDVASEKSFYLNENTNEIILAGTDFSKESKVRVYWNKEQNKYSLIADALPTAATGKQYQVWAISDGKPISIGLLNKENQLAQIEALNTNSIQAFAITLEKEGGSESPTMDQMMVVGNTNS